MPVDCGEGWEWNEALGRCVSADPPAAGPSLELPAGLEDYLRQAAEAVSGQAISASQWAGSRARSIAEILWNAINALAQNGITVADLPGIGEVQLLPGHLGEGMPFTVGGIPFRVRVVPHIGDSNPNGVWNDTQVATDQLDAAIAGLYWFAGPGPVENPTPILHMLGDVQGVKATGMLEQQAPVDWPVYRLHGEVFEQVAVYRVKASLKAELAEGWELAGTPLLKGSVDAAMVAYVLEHLQVEIGDTEAPGGVRMVPLASVVLPFVTAVSHHSLFSNP